MLAIRDDEPLAMGALGSALVERNPNNLTGNYALTAFYQHLDAAEATAAHNLAFDQRQREILATGDGSQERPYRVTSRAEAILTLMQDEKSSLAAFIRAMVDAAAAVAALPQGRRKPGSKPLL